MKNGYDGGLMCRQENFFRFEKGVLKVRMWGQERRREVGGREGGSRREEEEEKKE